jgi:hypothetical protein
MGYPLGLNIQESIYSWDFGRYRDLIFVRYRVTNSSNDTLNDCFLAPAFDPDLGRNPGDEQNDLNSVIDISDSLIVRAALPNDTEFSRTPAALIMGYQFHSGQPEFGMIAFAFVETPVVLNKKIINIEDSLSLGGYGPNSLYQKNSLGLSSFRQWTISNDPQTSAQRYDFVGSGLKDHNINNIAEMRLCMSTGPFTLIPNGSVTTTLAIGIAHPSTTVRSDNLDSLIRLMAFAHHFFGNLTSVPSDPNSITIHHFGGAPTESVKSSSASPVFDFGCSPNPMVGHAVISYFLAKRSSVKIEILTLLGQNITTIASGIEESGKYEKRIDLSMDPSGSYLVRFTINGITVTKSIVVIHYGIGISRTPFLPSKKVRIITTASIIAPPMMAYSLGVSLTPI